MSKLRPQYFELLKLKFFYSCSFILSHPLYFSYFIFFSPYILKLLSFLSPLFITTTLLLLALFTISPSPILHDNARGITRKDDELRELEEFEAYKIVFGASKVEFLESESPILDDDDDKEMVTTKHVIEEEKTLEVKKVDETIGKQEEDEALVRNVHSQGDSKNLENVGIGYGLSSADSSLLMPRSCQILQKHTSFGESSTHPLTFSKSPSSISYGSMRKEKEWERTLACKLFEERQNASSDSNSEGMDMLWEKYETDTNKNKTRRGDMKKMKKKGELKGYEDDEEEMDDDQQLCCLQALKFSAGKMNLGGMRRPNLVKISKAFKGFGWLHHVGKNNKKVHCGDDGL